MCGRKEARLSTKVRCGFVCLKFFVVKFKIEEVLLPLKHFPEVASPESEFHLHPVYKLGGGQLCPSLCFGSSHGSQLVKKWVTPHMGSCHCVCMQMWVYMVTKCIWLFFPGSGPVSSNRPEQSCEGISPNHSKLLWARNVWQGQPETRPGQGYSSGHQQKGQHQWSEYIVPVLEHWGACAFSPRTGRWLSEFHTSQGLNNDCLKNKQKRSTCQDSFFPSESCFWVLFTIFNSVLHSIVR